ncbi:amidohydrolase family protein [Azovibrio restrictus]|uniref:amidohydrolase family protein n=1 Tax=Azovibrio restrictus TaxID=146938 RepID=UPI000429DA4C|nr:twin-arginine translocation signal domain-containing protein [Azovibrio restrictus]
MSPLPVSRRRFLQGLGILAASGVAGWSLARPRLVNPCRAALPLGLSESPWLTGVWRDLNPADVWDCHAHLAGTGDGGSGILVGPQLSTPLRPLQYAQRLFYMNAGCAHDAPGRVDASYVDRMLNLVEAMPAGVKLMLFAFDHFHDAEGQPLPEMSAFYVPDDYARQLAAAHPQAFEWVASIHPYRADAVDRLDAAVAQGAKAIKWLPAAQNMDPASPRCDAFYAALARHRLPLITHCGEEKAVQGADTQHYGNPLRLRRALEAGVRVVVAHCASMGQDEDLDRGGRVESFQLFARLMDEPAWQELLAGDISAITLRNRDLEVIKTLLQRQDWHGRLLNGSDYPLPGILPLISPSALASGGLLPPEAVADLELLREHNPLYFDLALKRALSWQGQAFPARVFATRPHFEAQRS